MSQDLQVVWQEINDELRKLCRGRATARPDERDRQEEIYRLGIATVPAVWSNQHAIKALRDFHSLVILAIQKLQAGWPSITKRTLQSQVLVQAHGEQAIVDKAIDIALCLWPGIDCTATEQDKWKGWPESDSVSAFALRRRFDDPSVVEADDSIARFPPKFRAARLHDLSGIHIEQTYFLDQHLRFNEDIRTLKVFMDFEWLHDMLEQTRTRSPEQNPVSLTQAPPAATATGGSTAVPQQTSPLQPTGDPIGDGASALASLYEETLRSLDILFPAWDTQTMDFVANYRENGKTVPWFNLQDLGAQKQQSLRKFRYWRARFDELIIEFESPPKDLKRIWKDRRNPIGYWTFWLGLVIAASTLAFGLTSAVLAGLQLGRTPIPP